jgi:hypothetical protein
MKYFYIDDKLVDETGNAVMMGWEKPIMKKVAEIICHNKGKILNIGFGMGIVDTYIQEYNPSSHTIIERHPDVYDHMEKNGWLNKQNTHVIFDSWQNVMDDIGQFDGIYLDTWHDARALKTHELINKNLKVGGIFSMWYNKIEFNNIIKKLTGDYQITYEFLSNDGLIPSLQHNNGGVYIEPTEEVITIPIIKRLN